jgi:transposase
VTEGLRIRRPQAAGWPGFTAHSRTVLPATSGHSGRQSRLIPFGAHSRIDAQMRDTKKRLTAAIRASGTTVTEVFGVGLVIAATVIGYVADASRFPQPGCLRRL